MLSSNRKHISEISSREWGLRLEQGKKSPLDFATNMLFWDEMEFVPSYPQRLVLTSNKMNTFVCVHRRAGKEQPVYSKVYTPTGFVSMGSLQIGDSVLTPSGKVTSVLGVFPQGKKTVYRLHLDDGTYVDSGKDHLWEVYTKLNWKSLDLKPNQSTRHRAIFGNKILTTQEIKENLTYSYSNRKEFNYKLNPIQALAYTKKELEIDPYLLGVLLGDGSMPTRIITSTDDEILDRIINRTNYEIIKRVRRKGIISAVIKNLELKEALTKLDLIDKRSHDKFIPGHYLYTSVDDRIWLLRGLMDTDGGSDKRRKGQAEYCTVSPQLAKGVAELARSLGCKVRIKKSKAGYRKDGIYKQCKDRYRLQITIPEGLEIFSLTRKQCGGLPEKYLRRTIIEVEELEERVEMQCILVEDEDHLYVTDNCTPTHNTIVEAALLHDTALRYKKARIGVFTASQTQLDEIFQNFDAFRAGHPILENFLGPANNNSNPIKRTYDNGSIVEGHIFGTGYNPELIEAKRGKSYDFVFVDEAQSLHDEVWRVLGPIIAGNQHSKEYKRSYIFGTIVEPAGYFYQQIFEEPAQRPKNSPIHLTKEIVFTPVDKNPDISDILLEEYRSQCATESAWETEYLLKPSSTAAHVFRSEDIKRAFSKEYQYSTALIDPTKFRILAVDWDKVQAGTSIMIGQYDQNANHWEIIWREEVPRGEFTLTEAGIRIMHLREEFQVNLIASDSGNGEVQYEQMKIWAIQNGWSNRIIKINTQGNTKLPEIDDPTEEINVNTKQLMVQLTRDTLENGRLTFPKHDNKLADQFFQYKIVKETKTGPTYTSENEHFIDTVGFMLVAHKTNFYKFSADLLPKVPENYKVDFSENSMPLTSIGRDLERLEMIWEDRTIW